MLDINKQRMFYSKQGEKQTIYKKDADGNIVYYTTKSGEQIPIEEGETSGWGVATEFWANISNKLNEVLVKEFGVDDSTSYCQMVTDKDELPLSVGDVIWRKSDVVSDTDGTPDPLSADYTVKGVADEGLTVDLFLLRKVVK